MVVAVRHGPRISSVAVHRCEADSSELHGRLGRARRWPGWEVGARCRSPL